MFVSFLLLLQADGFEAAVRVGVKASHRGLLRDKKVFKLLKQWLGVSEKSEISMATSKVMDVFSEPVPVQMAAKDTSVTETYRRTFC